jgi:hypothetical protein
VCSFGHSGGMIAGLWWRMEGWKRGEERERERRGGGEKRWRESHLVKDFLVEAPQQ